MSTVSHILIFLREYFEIFESELSLLTDLEFSFAIQVVVLGIFNEKIECRNNHMYIVTCYALFI